MGFQKIGPYDLNRSDLIAASLVISFLTGSKGARIWGGLFALAGSILIGLGIVTGDAGDFCIGLGELVLIFVAVPGLRSLKSAGGIYLFCDPDGLVAETADRKVTYKWATIRSFRKVGSRLFIMVTGGSAVVVADRMTNPENMADLIATLADHQSA